eukprot:TRINITY_DN1734_c0_g1_i1.p1 TRINITY_DN1734_c0_g1~~TRINITY_DN1734_c0_g1_i1.p1  ORF type:complete len:322 (+),score=78.12 TRINITY_DN1734_c0_g1_i1:199-1164(+)
MHSSSRTRNNRKRTAAEASLCTADYERGVITFDVRDKEKQAPPPDKDDVVATARLHLQRLQLHRLALWRARLTAEVLGAYSASTDARPYACRCQEWCYGTRVDAVEHMRSGLARAPEAPVIVLTTGGAWASPPPPPPQFPQPQLKPQPEPESDMPMCELATPPLGNCDSARWLQELGTPFCPCVPSPASPETHISPAWYPAFPVSPQSSSSSSESSPSTDSPGEWNSSSPSSSPCNSPVAPFLLLPTEELPAWGLDQPGAMPQQHAQEPQLVSPGRAASFNNEELSDLSLLLLATTAEAPQPRAAYDISQDAEEFEGEQWP